MQKMNLNIFFEEILQMFK